MNDKTLQCSEDIINLSEHNNYDEQVAVCTESGLLPSLSCNLKICSSHVTMYLERNEKRKLRKLCEILFLINSHEQPDADMSLSNVEAINTLHGLVLPVGTGICRNCRKLLLDGQNKAVNKSINQEKIANKILDENNFAEVHYKQTRKIDQVTALDDSGPIKRQPDAKRSDRDMSLSNVEAINTLHGLVLPVGTGICRNCRKLLLDGQNKAVNKSINQEKIANKILDENNFAEVHYKQTRKIDQVTALDDSGPIKRTRQTITVESDPCSILEDTCSQETCESEQFCLSQISESSICNSMKLEALNSLLSFSGLSPVKELQGQISDASRRTQQRYIEKARQCLDVMCNTICPRGGEFLKSALLIEDETDQSEKVTLEVLVEIYKRADTWDFQRQILSIIADQHSLDDVKKVKLQTIYIYQ
ncbi:unnamed protein product [Mytilus coruscus]|uniref:Uncharacterized protein n=1 Tax=Mytilus coruscus TaxID=42192 RepID=A0A6J8EXC0_MYTCO|nr:unnamed protein product [Mytilus coruscus]